MLDLAALESLRRLAISDLPLAHCKQQLVANGFALGVDLRRDGYEPCRQSGDEHLSEVVGGELVDLAWQQDSPFIET